uniref:Uncharacterized protein n=1 Tax=Oryza glumipatula TaxID=40148 RepID=A0A0D9YCU2_9ORYZ
MTTPLAPFPFLKALSWRSAICPTNLQVKTLLRLRTSGDGVTRRVLLGGVASGKFRTSMTIDGPFGLKAFFPWHSARPKPLGSASFYGGRHTLRLLLRMKSELLAVGVRRRLATMTCQKPSGSITISHFASHGVLTNRPGRRGLTR